MRGKPSKNVTNNIKAMLRMFYIGGYLAGINGEDFKESSDKFIKKVAEELGALDNIDKI